MPAASPLPSDEDLARRHLAGDEDALRQLVERYAGPICRFARRFTRDDHDAEDMAQETFIRLYKHLPSLDLERPLKPWIYHICANLCRNLAAKSASTPFSFFDSGDDGENDATWSDGLESSEEKPDQIAVRHDTAEAVRAAVAALPEKYRTVVELYYFDDFSYDEIARILSLPLNTVRTHLRRAKAELEKTCTHLL